MNFKISSALLIGIMHLVVSSSELKKLLAIMIVVPLV